MIAKPFIKWVGGKTQLLSQFERFFPSELKKGDIKTYVEPFMGGGAVFFHVMQKYDVEKAYLNDINIDLATLYGCIKYDADRVIELATKLAEDYMSATSKRHFYYDTRENFNTDEQCPYDQSAHFLFLNKTCFNGLCRFNQKGKFNSPWGKYEEPKILDAQNIKAVAKLLQKQRTSSNRRL